MLCILSKKGKSDVLHPMLLNVTGRHIIQWLKRAVHKVNPYYFVDK